MASIINTNISSLNSQRNLAMNQASLATSMQRLSSGLRINTAKDDAAGLAIASRMSSQISGMNQAARNANDGISLAQTAEGGLGAATDLLQRMRDLAVQSANSTNSDADRASLQAEVAQIKSEIDRVANSTAFNGIKLLDGSFSAQTFQVGANASAFDRIQVNAIANMKTDSLGSGVSGTSTLSSGLMTSSLTAGDLTINGIQVGTSIAGSGAGQSASSAWSIAQAINAIGAQTGVTAKVNPTVATSVATVGAAPLAAADIPANSFAINGVSIGFIPKGVQFVGTNTPPTAGGPSPTVAQGANVAQAINLVTEQSGVRASVDELGQVTLASTNGSDFKIELLGTYGVNTFLSDTGLIGNTVAAGGTVISAAANVPTAGAYALGDMKINGVDLGAIPSGGTAQGQGANTAAAINQISGKTGVTATANPITGAVTLTAVDGRNIVLQDKTGVPGNVVKIIGIDPTAAYGGLNAAKDGTFSGTVTLSSSNVNGIVIAGSQNKYAGLHAFEGQVAADTSAASNTLSSVDIGTATGALSALATIDAALTQVNGARGQMGAYQNRFSSVVSNLQSTSENLTAARSRIQDADFAAETANLSRSQILQQAGTAMVAQANQMPQSVLQLLK
jgi:flagellin